MKKINKLLLILAAIFTMSLAMVSCGPDETGGDDPVDDTTLEISNVQPSFASVTFEVKGSEDIVGLAFICDVPGTELTPESVFTNGSTAVGNSGLFTVDGLEGETEYQLYVAARNQSGFVAPKSVTFTTLENSGEPKTSMSAGIRVEKVESDNFTFEVINGSEVDFSLIYISATIIIDNVAYENEKSGLSREETLKSLIVSNPVYTVGVEDAGTKRLLNFQQEFNMDGAIRPDANYSIVSLGVKGDIENDASWELGDIDEVVAKTLAVERKGSPDVTLETIVESYDHVKWRITPNADAACFALFVSTLEDITGFENYMEQKHGEGEGRKALAEWLRMYDAYADERTEEVDMKVNVALDDAGKTTWRRIALGLDGNLMGGDELRYADANTIPVPTDKPLGTYEMLIDSISATTLKMYTRMDPNCANVFWAMVPAGSNDLILSTYEGQKARAYELWDAGWTCWRPQGTNQNEDEEYTYIDMHYGIEPGVEYDIVATSLNYYGGLAPAEVIHTFTTLPRTFTNKPAGITVSAKPENIGKSVVALSYTVSDEQLADHPRIFHHRIYEWEQSGMSSDEIEIIDFQNMTDEEIRAYLVEGQNANYWTAVSNDTQDADQRDYLFTWAGKNPGTEYVCYYFTENVNGEISKLASTKYTTLSNDGGVNPALDIEVSNIEEVNEITYTVDINFIPNEDVTLYQWLLFPEKVIESWGIDPNDSEEFNDFLYSKILSEGIQSIEARFVDETYRTSEHGNGGYAAALIYGKHGGYMHLVYRKFNKDGSIDEIVSIPMEDPTSAPNQVPTMLRRPNSLESRMMDNSEALRSVKALSPDAPRVIRPEVESSLNTIEETPVTMAEISRKILTGEIR